MNVVIHAPTADSLRRARTDARELLALKPDANIRIVTDADGAIAADSERDPDTDPMVTVCENALRAHGLHPPPHLDKTPAAIELITRLQADGWLYVRA